MAGRPWQESLRRQWKPRIAAPAGSSLTCDSRSFLKGSSPLPRSYDGCPLSRGSAYRTAALMSQCRQERAVPQYTVPGVVIEEAGASAHEFDGVSTSVCLFVGPTSSAPESCASAQLEAVESGLEFEQRFGGLADIETRGGRLPNYVAHAARAFFDNGGRRLYVARVAADASTVDYAAALEATRKSADVSIVAAPGYSARPDALAIQQVLLDHVRGAAPEPASIRSPGRAARGRHRGGARGSA